MKRISFRAVAAAIAALASALAGHAAATAQELRVGVRAALDTADPASSYSPNRNITLQIYEPLLLQDASLKPVAGLAVAWRMRDPTTWEFTLREGVKFHDGSPLTPEDVAATIARNMATEVPQTYKSDIREIVSVEAEGPRTVILRTRAPSPQLPFGIATFGIVSARATRDATPEDFRGKAAIGTGPYRWSEWTPGQGVTLTRNPDYWGAKPHWDKVQFRFVPNDSARVASLLAGDLDVIDAVPPGLTQRIEASSNAHLLSTTAIMMLYLQLEMGRAQSPYVTDADGKPLPKNPFQDIRVRHALSYAINRAGIADRAMEGAAEPAGQFMAPGLDNHDPALKPLPYDPAKARALLAEAGYPKGFNITLACSNDRYPGDARVCQALGQMLGAVGIKTQVETVPISILFRRRSAGPNGLPDVPAFMLGYGAPNGLATSALTSLVQTQDRDRGRGGNNYTGYSNPKLDAMIESAMVEPDEAKRAALVREATHVAIGDTPVVPVYFTKAIWGLRRDLTLTPRADSFTFVDTIRPAK
ncbi:ABC transporter substrate-binding protein [Roseomonas sp. M0104]|uniref:ABC transporter substrate-binding protein n=1 Tax=Teichococcus coralli TaxID=2545983 RepID=A0A845BHT7_9PROT|nr:ABC transporter substrate-binding protein [Pseudoroseomonas coralli]MXP64762.1 ABC transporter substrate-binding protein [Pseudoroseomonas coralli]